MIIMVSSLLMAAASPAQPPPHPSLSRAELTKRLLILTLMRAGINDSMRPEFPGDELYIDKLGGRWSGSPLSLLHYLVTARLSVKSSFF